MNKFCVGAVALMLGMVLGLAQAEKQADGTTSSPASTKEVAIMKTTDGEMVFEFWPDVAPNTVANFKKLARAGFYNGTAFHRIVKGFMVQGGDPNTKSPEKEAEYGQGGPGYNVKAEFNSRPHERGVLSMARSRDPNSAGSQFFICLGRAEHLDGLYTAFGKLIKGDDVLTKISETPVKRNPYDPRPELSWPLKRVEIQSIQIVPADSVK